MDYRSLHMKTVADLRKIAKENGVKLPAGVNKAQIVERILEKERADASANAQTAPVEMTKAEALAEVETALAKTVEKLPVNENVAPQEAAEEKPAMPALQRTTPRREQGSRPQRMQPGAPRAPYNRPAMANNRMQGRYSNENTQRMQRPDAGTFRRPEDARNPRPDMQNGARKAAFEENVSQNRHVSEETPTVNPVQEQQRTAAAEENPSYDDMRSLNPAVPEMLAVGDCGEGEGVLEIHSEGYGFLRAENYLPGNRDAYVSAAQIRRFGLRNGDYVKGKTRPQQVNDRSVGLIFISEINGQTPDRARNRKRFDALVPVYPDERLRMETEDSKDLSLRLIDLIAPIGKGQRGMIVSPPKAGKTTLLKKIAHAIATNNPEAHLIVLLIDERPEEVTDMKRSIQGEVVYSTFDEAPENHTRVSEMVLERAQRLVELGKDVVVLLDSITRLARAYNLVIPPTGRSLSGGLDPGALFKPKRFFGAARNIENGGSLTIIATALVDTGSRMDDIIFEEFKGTGNMELHLDRSLSDRRIFPAIDMYRSGTRREELLMNAQELECAYQVRRMLSRGSAQDSAEQLISMVEKSKTNRELFQRMKSWKAVCEKEGYTK